MESVVGRVSRKVRQMATLEELQRDPSVRRDARALEGEVASGIKRLLPVLNRIIETVKIDTEGYATQDVWVNTTTNVPADCRYGVAGRVILSMYDAGANEARPEILFYLARRQGDDRDRKALYVDKKYAEYLRGINGRELSGLIWEMNDLLNEVGGLVEADDALLQFPAVRPLNYDDFKGFIDAGNNRVVVDFGISVDWNPEADDSVGAAERVRSKNLRTKCLEAVLLRRLKESE